MTAAEAKELVGALPYPVLEKPLAELGVVEQVAVEGDRADVILGVLNEEAFAALEEKIRALLSPHFRQVTVAPKTAKQNITYGSTKNPNNRAPYAKKVIAVTSGKGGVGKTTVSVNLSIALAQKGYKVGLLDADVYGPDVPRMLHVADEKLQWNDRDRILPSENFGIKMMSVGLTTPSHDTPLVWRSSVAISALIQFLEDVEWGDLDFLVIDMPPGTGDVQLTMAQELPLAAGVIVTTPQMVALDDVSRAIMMFKEIGIPIGGLVENMSHFIAPDTGTRYDIFGANGGLETAVRYQIPFLGEIPLKMEIREHSDDGKPPVAMGSDEEKALYRGICEKLLQNLEGA